mmetsp:Transcript_20063/g.34327  ORF Transcript_20063/g.34327 Transcript_20063/m.34327 type:complete len:374 (+) Transcript_20063:65-1186(+)
MPTLKALILVGGYGTRLRPLTFTKPKPLVEFANKPILFHQIDALVAAGVNEVVLAVSYKPESLVAELESHYQGKGVKIVFSLEDVPLGTAGPLALAKEKLISNEDGSETEAVFVLNSDVACEFHFDKLLNFHRAHGGEGTILTTPVLDPSKYGVVVCDENGLIERFVEKPKTFVGNKINAGIYLLSPKFIDRIKPVPTSIEVDVFPVVAAQHQLYCMELPGFWMDVGQPRDYLRGNNLYLAALSTSSPDKLATNEQYPNVKIHGNVLIHETAVLEAGSEIGPDVVVGPGCRVSANARLVRCTLLNDAAVLPGALVSDSIVGWQSKIGRWAHVVNFSVLGADVRVGEGLYLNGTVVCPHKSVKTSMLDAASIII